MPAPDPDTASCQARFHHRWGHLRDVHVRALAWLLDSPDLLDPLAAQWQGRIASLGPVQAATAGWLTALDAAPGELHAWLGERIPARLGRYAEKLMAFYFQRQGVLFAHGLQLRGAHNETLGEFDFLLWEGKELVHWEFASKFYLLESGLAAPDSDAYVGPNLADTLGAKLRKIMDKQLALSLHPAAQAILPQAVARAQALVKGWLFYRGPVPAPVSGVSKQHCRGFWCPIEEFDECSADAYILLPRLSWLAPARAEEDQCMSGMELHMRLRDGFERDATPQLIALMRQEAGEWREGERGFIVPTDWSERAGLARNLVA